MPAHSAFARVSSRLLAGEAPCQSGAQDWESSAGFLAEEHVGKPRQSTPDRLHLERALTLQQGAAGGGGVRGGTEGLVAVLEPRAAPAARCTCRSRSPTLPCTLPLPPSLLQARLA
jgi:hypothetical protein